MDAQTEKTIKIIASHVATRRAKNTVNLLIAYAFLIPVGIISIGLMWGRINYLTGITTSAIGLALLVFFVLSALCREDMIEYFYKRYYPERLNRYKEWVEKEE